MNVCGVQSPEQTRSGGVRHALGAGLARAAAAELVFVRTRASAASGLAATSRERQDILYDRGVGRAENENLRHLLPDRWWEKAAGFYLCTFKPDRGYAHILSLDPEKAARELGEIRARGFQAIEIFAPAEGRFGYAGLDMTDPYSIDRELGTMEDFRRFVRLAHSNSLAVVVFLNIGYFSIEAPAWIEAYTEKKAGRDTEKVRWFSWADRPDAPPPALQEDRFFASGVVPAGTPDAPKTWGWQHSEQAGCYYWARWQAKDEHGNWVGLPQTDWGSAEWPREAERIIRFWMDTGIDGMLVDAPMCYSRLTWATNNRYITDVISSYGNAFIQPEGCGDVAWLTEGGYNCLQDYSLGRSLNDAIRKGDPSAIEESLRGHRDLVVGAGGVLYAKVAEIEDPRQRRLQAATLAGVGDTLVYGTGDGPGPGGEEQWLLRTRFGHPALKPGASRRRVSTSADSTCYAFLKVAQDSFGRVLVVLNFSATAQTVEVDLSTLAATGLVNLRTGERCDRALPFSAGLPPYGYAFLEVLPARQQPSLGARER
jgi:hypothetical protein